MNETKSTIIEGHIFSYRKILLKFGNFSWVSVVWTDFWFIIYVTWLTFVCIFSIFLQNLVHLSEKYLIFLRTILLQFLKFLENSFNFFFFLLILYLVYDIINPSYELIFTCLLSNLLLTCWLFGFSCSF